MPTLGNQNISTSYPQLLKTFGTGGIDGNLQVITDGDNTSSALSLSTAGVKSTGTFAVDGTSLLTGDVTFGAGITASTGTATIATASISTASISTATISTATISTSTISTATISTATISTATIPLQLGSVTFGSNVTISTGTATIGTLSASTATISTATIPSILGATTFSSTITASTGTNTLGTINCNTATLGTLSVTSGASVATTATVGTARIGASGPSLTRMTYTTATYTGGTVQDIDHVTGGSNTSTGTFAAIGVALGDIVTGSLNSIGSATGVTPARLMQNYRVEGADVVRFVIFNTDQTAGTIPAGTFFTNAIRLTA